MLRIGEINTLEVLRKTSVGLFLGDEDGFDVLLPNKYVPQNVDIGDSLEVFIYKDQMERPVATTLTPKIMLDSFAFLRVNYVNEHGTFMDWGLEKDLMVPFGEQMDKMRIGESYIIYMYIDKVTARLVGSARWAKFLETSHIFLQPDQEIEILVAEETQLGFTVIVNQRYRGLVYHNELFKPLEIGETHTAFVKQVREDGRIDVRMQPVGYQTIEPNGAKILQILQESNGFMPLHDDSAPEVIYGMLEMSKKSFKKAIGTLYKQDKIVIEAGKGIRLKV